MTTPITAVSNIAGAANGIANLLNGRGQTFWSQLQPASFRGLPFAVLTSSSRFGRRNAVHEYPFRDTPWVEDLGRQSRRITLTGFIVGDDVIAQRERFIRAAESPGDGKLVHPTLGSLTVSLIEFAPSERWDQGRVVELSFTFLEAGQRQFPGQAVTSAGAISDAAGGTSDAAGATWLTTMRAQLAQSANLAAKVGAMTQHFAAQAFQAVSAATGLMNIATSLQGNFGRLLGQNSGIPFGKFRGVSNLSDLIGIAAAARATVATATTALSAASTSTDSDSLEAFQAQSAALALAVRTASFTPADALRSMATLADLPASGDVITSATSDLFRRIAVAELANASAAYQPSTTEEASAVRTQVLVSIDGEMTIAGDQGDDDVYAAMRGLRAEVIRDMNAKGAQLPSLVTVRTRTPVPSLVLAQQLYRDSSRNDELERRGNPPHPAFMPLSFLALSA